MLANFTKKATIKGNDCDLGIINVIDDALYSSYDYYAYITKDRKKYIAIGKTNDGVDFKDWHNFIDAFDIQFEPTTNLETTIEIL
jgi:hypothetical protein